MNLNGIKLFFLLLPVCLPLQAKELGALRAKADLVSAPYRDAGVVASLAANTAVCVFERRGAWLRVASDTHTQGWVRLHQVRLGTGQAGQSGESLGLIANVAASGRSGSHGIVATTGVRGLTAEELQNAKPSPEAVKSLERYHATPAAAREFAKLGGLQEKDVSRLTPTK